MEIRRFLSLKTTLNFKNLAVILEKIDEIISILAKKFCDKNETKKALIYMENRVIIKK